MVIIRKIQNHTIVELSNSSNTPKIAGESKIFTVIDILLISENWTSNGWDFDAEDHSFKIKNLKFQAFYIPIPLKINEVFTF